MSNAFVPLKRSERLHDALYKKYVADNIRHMLSIKKIMDKKMVRASMKEKIVHLTKIMETLTKGFKSMLLYGVHVERDESEEISVKMFKNVYFKTFVWMKEADKQPEGQQVLGKRVEKYRKIYQSYRTSKIGIIQDAFGLTDDLMDVIDRYL